jgi:hypothetical protein
LNKCWNCTGVRVRIGHKNHPKAAPGGLHRRAKPRESPADHAKINPVAKGFKDAHKVLLTRRLYFIPASITGWSCRESSGNQTGVSKGFLKFDNLIRKKRIAFFMSNEDTQFLLRKPPNQFVNEEPRSKLEASLLAGIFVGEEIADLWSDYTLPRASGFFGPYPNAKIV